MVQEFAEAITTRRPPRTDGRAGLRVLEVLDAASRSLGARGELMQTHSVDEFAAGGVA